METRKETRRNNNIRTSEWPAWRVWICAEEGRAVQGWGAERSETRVYRKENLLDETKHVYLNDLMERPAASVSG